MSDTHKAHAQARGEADSAARAHSSPLLLLAWDAPNMDMALSELLGGKPEPRQRPIWWKLGIWLTERAEALGATAEAVVFVNLPDGGAERMRPWIEAVRRAGFAVFVKPKRGDSDIDDDIESWLRQHAEKHRVCEVLIASGDRRAFQGLLEEFQSSGRAVAFLGFTEFAGVTTSVPFIDLESVPGLFEQPLPRTRLENLPDDGALLIPLGRLGHRPPHAPGSTRVKPTIVDPNKSQELTEKARATLERLLATTFTEAYTTGVSFSTLWDALSQAHPKLTTRLGTVKAADAFALISEGLPLHVERSADGIARVIPDADLAASA